MNKIILSLAVFCLAFKSTDSGLPLKQIAPFKVGVAVNLYNFEHDNDYAATVNREFNSVTAEGSMKWKKVHPALNTYNFTESDGLIRYAQAHHLRVHGHNLIWNQDFPDWLVNYQGSQQQWLQLMHDHIQTEVSHFGNKVSSWDVVNEAFNNDGSQPSNGTINLWYTHLGPAYVADAFKFAYAANPNVKLFYNDDGMEKSPAKLNAVLGLIRSLKSQHVHIDGIGIEMHINTNTTTAGIRTALNKLAATGLLIHISELDISLSYDEGADPGNDAALVAKQIALYQAIPKLYIQNVPAAQRFGITFWGLNDGNSWLPKQYHNKDQPLIFDYTYHKKPAYAAFLKGLTGK